MSRALYVLGGPLIWLASLLLLLGIGAQGCAGSGLVLAIQLLAVAGCVAILYRSLTAVRTPSLAGNDQARLLHFFAGGLAVLAMVAIGASALATSYAASC